MFPSVLIVDDEPSILQSLSGLLTDEGYEVITAFNGYEALKIIDKETPDLVLLDIWMPGIDGIETLKEIKKSNPYIQVIIITGHGTVETAVKSTKLGAFDLIEKPLSIDKVIVSINNALNYRRLEEENRYLRKKTIEKHSINGNSPTVEDLKNQIATAAPTDAWILISGENGSGKELVAHTIHQFSSRAEHPMIDISCAAIPDDVIESELFGHEKGTFEGVSLKKRGKFELADNGTLFFDEIGDMSLKTQGKILRVLQEQRFQRVGGNRTLDMKARIIAASNKNLEKEIEKGKFREDLYYRLNVIPINVPPLRKRKEDIPLLSEMFLQESAKKNRNKKKSISSEVLKILCEYSWPGNVRELKNLVERLAIMVEGDVIGIKDIPMTYRFKAHTDLDNYPSDLFSIDNLKEASTAFEKSYIKFKLSQHDNNIEDTAKLIGITPSYISKNI